METLPRSLHPLIGGRRIPCERQEPVRDPYTGEVIARVGQAGPAEIEAALQAAIDAARVIGEMPRHRRAELLGGIAAGLRRDREGIARLIVREAGKPVQYAQAEVDRAISTFTFAAEEAKRVGGEYVPMDAAPAGEGYLGVARRFPIGPVTAISPFNFPLNLIAHKVAPALAAGNPVIVKPPPQAPLASLVLADLADEIGIPAGVLQVVPCAVGEAERLVTDERVAMLSFTGSAAVGWRLKEKAGRKRILLELGGNAAAIVEQDADLDWTVPRLAVGAFAYAGQVCISVQRILVHRAIEPEFLERLSAAVKELPVGDPSDPRTVVGPLIDDAAAERVETWVREAVSSGARLLCGGGRRGRVMEPVVLTGVPPQARISCEEAFGPVVTVRPYDDFAEAIRLANDSAYGLQAGVFTRDIQRAAEAFRSLQVGGVIVNDYPMFRVDQMPYGGTKASGLGREGVRYAIEAMTETKLWVIRTGLPL